MHMHLTPLLPSHPTSFLPSPNAPTSDKSPTPLSLKRPRFKPPRPSRSMMMRHARCRRAREPTRSSSRAGVVVKVAGEDAGGEGDGAGV